MTCFWFLLIVTITSRIGVVAEHNYYCYGRNVVDEAVFCPESSFQMLLTADYNGDGKMDLNCIDVRGTVLLLYANDNCTYDMFDPAYWGQIGTCPTGEWKTGDFNGDGKADILCHTGTELRVDFANVNGTFDSNITVEGIPSECGGHRDSLHIGDFNGDGSDEWLCYSPKKHTIRINHLVNGALQNIASIRVGNNWCSPLSQIFVGDYNNDERSDIICMAGDGNSKVYYTSESEYFANETNYDIFLRRCRGKQNQKLVGDFNGDGYDDILCRRKEKDKFYVHYHTEEGFLSKGRQGDLNWCGHPSEAGLYAGDVNGDGIADIICSNWDEYRNGDLTIRFSVPR